MTRKDEPKDQPPAEGGSTRRSLGRRLLVVALGAAAGATVPVAQAMETTPVQYRTNITDNDPGDPLGNGRGRRMGLTDNDPGDPAGKGRGGYRARGRTGLTDNDPGDPPGNGRGRPVVRQPRLVPGPGHPCWLLRC